MRIAFRQIDGGSLFADQDLELSALHRVGRGAAPAGQAVLQLGKPLVETGPGQRRGQMADRHCAAAPFRQGRLGRVVRGIKVDIRDLADQPVWPVRGPHTRLFAWHEFQCPVHPEMQQNIGLVSISQPEVKGGKSVGRGKAALEQQAHRIALVAERRLHTDKNIAEMLSQHKDVTPVGLHPTRRGTPDRFYRLKMGGAAHNGLGADPVRDIGFLTVSRRVAFEHGRP